MPEPERHTPVSAPRPVQAGLGVEDIRHIPVQKRELRFTRNRAGAILTAAGVLLAATAAFLQILFTDAQGLHPFPESCQFFRPDHSRKIAGC